MNSDILNGNDNDNDGWGLSFVVVVSRCATAEATAIIVSPSFFILFELDLNRDDDIGGGGNGHPKGTSASGASVCPKRVGCFGSSTRFQMRKVVGKWYEWYRFCKKIMSLVYAKKSDDIGMCFMCASRVSICKCSVCSVLVSRYLMY